MTRQNHLIRILIASLFILASSAQAQTKIATINLKKVFDGYWKRIQADKTLKMRAKSFDDELAKMRDEFKAGTKDLPELEKAVKDTLISETEKAKRQKAFEAKVMKAKELEQAMIQFNNSARASLDELQRQTRGDLLAEIRDHVRKKAKSEGVNLVIDTAAETINQTPVFVFHDDSNDWTDNVLSTLNIGAPKEILEELKKK